MILKYRSIILEALAEKLISQKHIVNLYQMPASKNN